MGSDKLIGVKTLAEWQAFARTDRCLNAMVPSDLRLILQEVASLRAALERCIQTLETCDVTGQPHLTLDAAIVGIAKVAGEGPTMRSIVYAWRRHLEEAGVCQSALTNHFTVGPTRYAVMNALAVGRSALGAKNEHGTTQHRPGGDQQDDPASAGADS